MFEAFKQPLDVPHEKETHYDSGPPCFRNDTIQNKNHEVKKNDKWKAFLINERELSQLDFRCRNKND